MSRTWMYAQTLSAVLFAAVASADASDPLTVEDFITLGLRENQQLQAAQFQVQSAQASLTAARAAFRPTLELSARYTRSEGGRTINFPIGDALNPVYRTLNSLSAGSANPTQFGQVPNNAFELLRGTEQDSRLKLSAPLYAPLLDAALNAAAARAQDANASREIYARTLVRDIRRAYSGVGQAGANLRVLNASELVLAENVRVNQALVVAGSATKDRALRANAELLAVQDRLETTRSAVGASARYLNFLVNRPLDTAVAPATLGPATLPRALEPAPGASTARPELDKLAANVALASAGIEQARAAVRPSVGFGLDAGIQGENYGFGSGKNFATAAIVFNWRLFDFGQNRAQTHAAVARLDALTAERTALLAQLELAARQARDDWRSAGKRLVTAQARQLSAEEGFRIVARKRDAGAATQIEFLDAERARTEAELALLAARFDQANQAAELELALASYPLTDKF
jgi:outer membrane protein